jgi:hypothetical protein
MSEGGNGELSDLTPVILREIRDELRGLRGGVDETNRRLEEGFAAVNARIDKLGDRIDNVLIGPMGQTTRELVQRVSALEERMTKLEGSS